MRILMLNYEFPPLGGGASPVSYDIAKGYIKLGHDVDVVTMGYRGQPSFEVKDRIQIYRVPCFRSKKEICKPYEMFSYIVSARIFLNKQLKKVKYDVNHTHFIIPTGIISLWAKRKFGLPYIVTSHGSDVLGYNKRFAKLYPLFVRLWKKVIKEARAVTTPTLFLQKEIRKITTDGNFVVIPNGINPDEFKPMKKEKRILVVARLFPNKGVQDILDALKGLDLKGWKVDIVGDGPYRQFLEKKTKENGLENVVTFHGWADNKSKKMKEFYGHASIFVSASYFENMSMVLLEALASGCMVIAPNAGGIPEVLPEKNMFRAKNVVELKEKLSFFVQKYRKSPLEKDINFNSGQMIHLYDELLL